MRKLALICLVCLAAGCSSGRRASAPAIGTVTIGDAAGEGRLVRGFLESGGAWRWTGRVFAVSLDPPPRAGDVYIELDFGLPRELAPESRPLTLTARVNGTFVGQAVYSKAERCLFAGRVPAAALKRAPAEIRFELDRTFTSQPDGRERGLMVVSAALLRYEETTAYRGIHAPRAREAYRQIAAWQNFSMHNVQIEKNPLDLWNMRQIVYEIRPDFIVETGTAWGGSALFWAETLHGMGLQHSRVLTVDIADATQTASTDMLWKKYVDFYFGSSTDPSIVSAIRHRAKGRKVLVSLDSDHSMRHVLRELKAYAPLVSRGSYIIVEDTHIDGIPTYFAPSPGPMGAVVEFLKQGGARDFEQDLSRETLGITYYPGGWLRRK
jgi:cephalosporin hydroxylase